MPGSQLGNNWGFAELSAELFGSALSEEQSEAMLALSEIGVQQSITCK